MTAVSASRGSRVIPAEDFFISHFTTALADDELLTEVEFPASDASTGAAFEEMARRHGDFAIVGVATTLRVVGGTIEAARVVLTGVSATPFRSGAAEAVLLGAEPSEAVFAEAAAAVGRRDRPAGRSARDVGLPSLCRGHLDPAEPGARSPKDRSPAMNPDIEIDLTVNGVERHGATEARKTLADFLRDDLGLTGTHVGCEHGVCGACTVLVDDEPVRSCLMFAVQATGRRVRTIEGLAL